MENIDMEKQSTWINRTMEERQKRMTSKTIASAKNWEGEMIRIWKRKVEREGEEEKDEQEKEDEEEEEES